MGVTTEVHIVPPDFTFNDEGKLNRACHVTLVVSLTRDGESIPFRVMNHRAPLTPDSNGVWSFCPHPVQTNTQMPFKIADADIAQFRSIIAAMVGKFGLADEVASG